ncbi:MAG: zinc metallopeptidase [Granulosicoccus sp.]|nr:zinc metallopeptidase [Granulosicoccus sp.]
MRWRGGRRSSNVEDRRGMSAGRRGLPGGGGLKIGGGVGIIVLLVSMFLGVDLTGFLGSGGSSGTAGLPQLAPPSAGPARTDDEATDFVKAMMAYNEDVWSKLFREANQQYQPPKLIIFDGGVSSACGFTSSAAGPFYCPGDYQVYIDLNFFRELQKMGAGGDFAQAYVLAHEVGHHVQNLLGVSMAVQKRQRSVSKTEANQLSVRTELQADCYAGVWAHHAHKDSQLLEPGDLEEGMNAAARIGDDALMSRAGARVRPEAFTHGSSKQRQEWLYVGLNSGDPTQCDTFGS